jgi:hypothetical protein
MIRPISEIISLSRSQYKKIAALTLFFSFFAVYSLLLTQNSYFTRDPIDVAVIIERSHWAKLFPADHLLYRLTGWTLYQLGQIFNLRSALVPLQIISVVTGAGGVAIFFRTIDDLVNNRRIALLCALFLAFSYGYWRYAEEGMPYPVMMFFLAWSMALILKTGPDSRPSHFLLTGVVTALAALYHQMAFFLVLVVALAVFWHCGREDRKRGVRNFLLYVVSFSLFALVPYLLVMLFVREASTPEGILRFTAANLFTLKNSLGLAQFSFARTLKGVFGLGNLFVGEIFVLNLVASRPAWARTFVRLVPAVSLPPVEYARQAVSFELLLALFVLIVALFILLALYFFRHLKCLWVSQRRVLVICLVWALPVSLFALWYFPENVHFWIPILIPCGVILALILQDAQGHRGSWLARNAMVIGWLFVLSLFAINLMGSILPAHDPGSNWNRDAALQVGRYADHDDLVITLGVGDYKHLPAYLDYYVGRYPLAVSSVVYESLSAEAFRQHIKQSFGEGHSVFVFADVFDSCLGYVGMSRLSGKPIGQIQGQTVRLFQGYCLQEVDRGEGHPRLYELKSPADDQSLVSQAASTCAPVTLSHFTVCPTAPAP